MWKELCTLFPEHIPPPPRIAMQSRLTIFISSLRFSFEFFLLTFTSFLSNLLSPSLRNGFSYKRWVLKISSQANADTWTTTTTTTTTTIFPSFSSLLRMVSSKLYGKLEGSSMGEKLLVPSVNSSDSGVSLFPGNFQTIEGGGGSL